MLKKNWKLVTALVVGAIVIGVIAKSVLSAKVDGDDEDDLEIVE